MERLTFFESGCWWIRLNGCMYGGFPEVDRLAAYEDTMPIERAQELAQAEKDGRLVVLPCKIGDTVYRLLTPTKRIIEHKIRTVGEAADVIHCLNNEKYIVPVYLTREEAEAALKKRGEADNEAI